MAVAVNNKPVGALPTDYIKKKFTPVINKELFYKGNKFPECQKIKNIISVTKQLFHLPDDKVTIEVAENERLYKINFHTVDVKKSLFASIIFIPLEKRVDIMDHNLILQYKMKKPVYKGYSYLFDRLQIDKIFYKIVDAAY